MITTVLSLGLGIGAGSAAFGVLDAVVAYTPGAKALPLGDDQLMVTGGVVSPNVFK